MVLHKHEIPRLLEKNLTKKGFSFWKVINEGLPDIWERPTSSTGKYHKKTDGTVPDIAEHVYQMLYAAVKLFSMFSITPNTGKSDMLLLAIALHDCVKYGKDGKREYTDNKHDQAAGDIVGKNREVFKKFLTESQVDILEDSIRFHSGQWSTDIPNRKDFNFADRDPIAQWVHTLDMMSTNDLIKTDLDDIPF